MLYDPTVKDACFVEGRPPSGIDGLLAWARHELGLDDHAPWRLISARRKLGRTLFEIEEQTPSGPRRLIGKIGDRGRSATLYKTLRSLRDAGFAPPARYTVPEPVAFIEERGFVLQEKVPGEQAAPALMKEGADSRSAATDSAKWLAALHRCGLPADEAQPDANPVWNWANDLASIQRFEAGRIHRIAQAILRELAKPVSGRVPCHGDFHPMNIFIANERVTGIDIDKFALREPESDVAWFLMQTAAQDFFKNRSFDCTEEARQTFVETYEAEIGRPIRPQRVGLYMAMAFLKNLHFELVLLKTGRNEYAQPWLRGAAAALLEGNLHLAS